ncbi:Tn3 family transposase, partial [Pseudomonas aeruginosa]|uniref:Tn3 family transposase n=1 Tax=Pseudomonas aeruginosa TaxID=287 RepID=UPI003967E3CA
SRRIFGTCGMLSCSSWNTMKLGEVVANQKRDGKLLSPDLLAHVSPLGWEHINLTGEYRWPKP